MQVSISEVCAMSIKQKLITVDEFEAFLERPENDDRLFELIHGEIVEKLPTQEHGFICAKFIMRVGVYLERRQNNRIGAHIRHQVPGDQYNDRLPDVSVQLDTSRPIVKRGAVPGMPDVVMDVKLPDQTYTQMRARATYYLTNGTRLVWLTYPRKQLVEVWHRVDDREIFDITDTLDGGDLLPGFTLAVKDMFPA
jgi:Uma2 family endonuclease